MTTTSSTARPTTGAGPNPRKNHMDNRTYERLLNGIKAGKVRLDPNTYLYRNTANNADLSAACYEAADRGWITLAPGEDPALTAAGRAWLADRYRRYGTSPTRPVFLAPDNANAFKVNDGPYRGERIPTAKLSEQQVRTIKTRLDAGEQASVLARDYHVDPNTIYRIADGTTWKHITQPTEVPS
ncbi:hypothetical protein ACIBCR_14860 [Micromonospora echinospora]|uniref:hypothetical protein n=1 Tax=Micromonospora echinospora TaxID=1877 RepID=UPI0037B6210E